MYTVQSLKQWAGSDYKRWNKLSVARASWGVYQFLKQNLGFGYKWAKGVERSDYNSKLMEDALNKAAEKSANALQFAAMVDSSLPADRVFSDPEVKKRINRILRENP